MSQQVDDNIDNNSTGPENERSKLRAWNNAPVPEAFIAGFDELGADEFSHQAHVQYKDLEDLDSPKLKRRALLCDSKSLPSSELVGECQLVSPTATNISPNISTTANTSTTSGDSQPTASQHKPRSTSTTANSQPTPANSQVIARQQPANTAHLLHSRTVCTLPPLSSASFGQRGRACPAEIRVTPNA